MALNVVMVVAADVHAVFNVQECALKDADVHVGIQMQDIQIAVHAREIVWDARVVNLQPLQQMLIKKIKMHIHILTIINK